MKLIIDLDAPDQLPLRAWLMILKRIRVQHEYKKDLNANAAARRLGVNRGVIYRAL